MIEESDHSVSPAKPPPFFQKVDWITFCLGAFLALVMYLFSLAPEVTLEYSGIYGASAMHPGPSMPPGHPIWVVYGWLFIKLIPFGNIAWRLNLASAVAGALICGLIALMVSRIGLLVVESISRFKTIPTRQQTACRLVCGCVAGLGFALDGCFWPKAVITDTWPLSLLFLSLSLCLLARWFFRPVQRLPLYLATMVGGFMVIESQALIPAALGFLILLSLGDRKLGRDAMLLVSLCLWLLLWRLPYAFYDYHDLMFYAAILSGSIGIGLCWLDRKILSEWPALLCCITLLLIAFSSDFLLAVFSMTNPPVNWGYPRTVEGFFHVTSRGQYCSSELWLSRGLLLQGWRIYLKISADDLGVFYLLAAAVPGLLLTKLAGPVRRWLVGMFALWFFTNFLMLAVLMPQDYSRATIDINAPYFAATHLILSILGGCGLMLVAALCARPTPGKVMNLAPSPSPPSSPHPPHSAPAPSYQSAS
ncbi:MAG TPA: DUF2723 domain-containing protein [Candidatus Acidoferrales bacterium]|jgi:hypothetical protein|nr:DUF2723 domain-containing protein [Candidatus Acidoferrales bacterium]